MKLEIKPSELIEALDYCERSNNTPFIIGKPGVGKSALSNQYAKARPYYDERLNIRTPVDLGGFPRVDHEKNRMRFALPAFLPDPDDKDPVILLDEFTTAPKQTQNVALQITHDKRVGEWTAPKGTFIILASNSALDKCHTERVSAALGNRVLWLYLRPDLDDTTEYMLGKNLDVRTVAFLRFRPDLLHSFDPQKWDGESGFPTPRSWEQVARLTALSPRPGIREALYNGLLGYGPSTEYVAFLSLYEKLPSIDGILLDPQGGEIPDDPATKYAVICALVNRVSKESAEACFQYFARMPKEFEVFGVKTAYKTKKDVLTASKSFIKWAVDNREVIG
jgi:hypothetical protein